MVSPRSERWLSSELGGHAPGGRGCVPAFRVPQARKTAECNSTYETVGVSEPRA